MQLAKTELLPAVRQIGQPATEQDGACLLKLIGVTLGVVARGERVDA